jgi:hypothetical protein
MEGIQFDICVLRLDEVGGLQRLCTVRLPPFEDMSAVLVPWPWLARELFFLVIVSFFEFSRARFIIYYFCPYLLPLIFPFQQHIPRNSWRPCIYKSPSSREVRCQ